jgi:membrane fusion protein (multidrug efflux system)
MRKYLSYIIALSLVAIVILMLMRNKQEINAQIIFAEKKVDAYPVKVEEVKIGTLDTKLELSGTLSGTNELMLMAETQGRIKSIFRKEGDWVKKGEAIAQVDDELMRAELMVTEANFEKARKDLERAQTLSDGGAITQQQLEGLQLNVKAAEAKYTVSKKRVQDARITSPISGYINKMFLKEGGMIGPAVPACELVNIKSLKMSVKVDEEDVGRVFPNQEVTVKATSSNGTVLKGTIVSVSAKADYALQYGVEIVIPENPDEKLKAGMVAEATFLFRDELTGPVISQSALVGSTKNPEVYVVENGKANLKGIKISHQNGSLIKLAEGLSAGDRLVTAGQFNLRDGMPVKVIE